VRLRSVILTDTEDTKDPNGVQTNASQVMRNITVTGNTMREGLGYDAAIIVRGETSGTILNVTIVGNTMDTTTNAQHGIQLVQVSRVTVADNVIANVAGTGVSCSNLNNVNVDGNVVWGAGANGITAGFSDNSNIMNNQIRDPGNNGVFINDSTDIQIRQNFVQGARQSGGTGPYYGIRVSTNCASVVVSSNKVRPTNPRGTAAQYAFSCATTTGTNYRYGNDWNGTYATANTDIGTGWTSSALDAP
jgi:hypothetical protein